MLVVRTAGVPEVVWPPVPHLLVASNPVNVGSTVAALLSLSVKSAKLAPVQFTGCEKLMVTVVPATAPDADTIVGAPPGGTVALAVCPCGALIVLPEASTKFGLQVVFAGLTQAPAAVLRSTSTNAPGGIVGAPRKRFALVTPLSFAAVQRGVLSEVTGEFAAFETFLTVQSVANAPTAVLQTGSLYVTVTTFD